MEENNTRERERGGKDEVYIRSRMNAAKHGEKKEEE